MSNARSCKQNPGVVLGFHTCKPILCTVIVWSMKMTLRSVGDRTQGISGCSPLSVLELFKSSKYGDRQAVENLL